MSSFSPQGNSGPGGQRDKISCSVGSPEDPAARSPESLMAATGAGARHHNASFSPQLEAVGHSPFIFSHLSCSTHLCHLSASELKSYSTCESIQSRHLTKSLPLCELQRAASLSGQTSLWLPSGQMDSKKECLPCGGHHRGQGRRQRPC